MSSIINNSGLTKYPKIFQNTYWDAHAGGSDPSIIYNRNKFVEEFDIKRFINISDKRLPLGKKRFKNEINPEYPQNATFDHFELYERNGGLGMVAVFSPYHEVNPKKEYYQQMIDMGYKKYRRLYTTGCEDMKCPTYILVIPK